MSYKKIFDSKGASRKDWLKVRKMGLGGSDMAAVLGVSQWASPIDVWLDKTSDKIDEKESEAMYWGTVLEDVVAKEFERRTGMKVRNNNFTLQSEEYPYLLANIDREIVGVDSGLECKTANAFLKGEWDDDKVPNNYYVQCQHYMAVTGKASWWIAVLIGGNNFVYKEIPRDEEVINAIIEVGREFWHLVETKTMPAVDGSDACSNAIKSMFPTSNGESMILDSSFEKTLIAWEQAKLDEQEAKDRRSELENAIKLEMGENEAATLGDWKITYKSSKPRESFDSKRFATDHPDMYTEYVKMGAAARPFKIVRK